MFGSVSIFSVSKDSSVVHSGKLWDSMSSDCTILYYIPVQVIEGGLNLGAFANTWSLVKQILNELPNATCLKTIFRSSGPRAPPFGTSSKKLSTQDFTVGLKDFDDPACVFRAATCGTLAKQNGRQMNVAKSERMSSSEK